MFENIGEMVLLLARTFRALPEIVRQRKKVYEQLFEIGNASLLMACILSLFIGGVIALQTGPLLAARRVIGEGQLGFSALARGGDNDRYGVGEAAGEEVRLEIEDVADTGSSGYVTATCGSASSRAC